MQLTLHIINCPEEYTGNKHIEMSEDGGTVGRDPSCRVTLSDHNKYISGNHSLVTFYGGTYYLSDTSTNGTFINDHKIFKNQPVALHQDDLILMGRYEFSVSLENMVKNTDISVDIDPRSNNDDPLSCLDVSTIESISDNQGVIDDLFIETQGDDVNSDDPIAHIDFNMEKVIGLLDDEEPKIVPSSRADWQIPDDFESVHSEFDVPSIIPEDWMANSTKELMVELKPEPTPARSPLISNVEITEQTDIATTALSSGLVSDAEIVSDDVEQVVPYVKVKQTTEHTESIDAFFKGVGIDDLALRDRSPKFFNQMGSCLRLCLDKMNTDLEMVSSFKGSAESNNEKSSDDILRLMLTLNQQDVLSPSELLQQVLDELDSHHKIYHQAVTSFVVGQAHQYDPVAFSDALTKEQLFVSKRKIWDEYVQHYRTQLNNECYSSDVLLHEKLKEHYSTIMKVENA